MLPGQLENEISAQVDRRSRDLLHALPTVMWAMSTFNTEQVGVPRKFYQKRKRKFVHQTTNSKKKKRKNIFNGISAPRLVSRRLSNLLRSRNVLPSSHPSAKGPAGYASSSAHRPSRISNEDTIIGQNVYPGRQ